MKSKMIIKEWAEEDRPREKLLSKGIDSLSNAEILAIILRSGSREETAVELGKNILSSVGNNLNELGKLSVNDLCKYKGVGKVKAIGVAAALEIGRRRMQEYAVKKEKITTSSDVNKIFSPVLADISHEEFWILLLNVANKVIKKVKISQGGLAGTVTDIRMIFRTALENKATAVILVHNHPSGNVKPSIADRNITKKIKNAGKTMDIPVLDHLIVTSSGFFSFADEAYL